MTLMVKREPYLRGQYFRDVGGAADVYSAALQIGRAVMSVLPAISAALGTIDRSGSGRFVPAYSA